MLPTIILGMISPYSVRLLVENVEESGKVAGALYFTSTLGSAIGTLVTSFYLVLWFEVNSIITILTLILLGIAVVAWFFAPGQQSTMDKNSDASG
jgi:MFS family permease